MSSIAPVLEAQAPKPKPEFFVSTAHPRWKMNRYGVVYRNDEPDKELGFGTILRLADSDTSEKVQQEALEAGYTYRLARRDVIWHKPILKHP